MRTLGAQLSVELVKNGGFCFLSDEKSGSSVPSLPHPLWTLREEIDLMGLFPLLISMPMSFPLLHRNGFSAFSVFTPFKACNRASFLLHSFVAGQVSQ